MVCKWISDEDIVNMNSNKIIRIYKVYLNKVVTKSMVLLPKWRIHSNQSSLWNLKLGSGKEKK